MTCWLGIHECEVMRILAHFWSSKDYYCPPPEARRRRAQTEQRNNEEAGPKTK